MSGQELSGLEQLQAMIASGRGPSMGETLDFTLVEVEVGRAVFEGTPGAGVLNPMGTVHGGWSATLLDSACGVATHSSLKPGQTYATLELKVSFHKPVTTTTGLVRAEGKLLSIGRRVAFAEAKLTNAAGRLLASATSTLMVMDQ